MEIKAQSRGLGFLAGLGANFFLAFIKKFKGFRVEVDSMFKKIKKKQGEKDLFQKSLNNVMKWWTSKTGNIPGIKGFPQYFVSVTGSAEV